MTWLLLRKRTCGSVGIDARTHHRQFLNKGSLGSRVQASRHFARCIARCVPVRTRLRPRTCQPVSGSPRKAAAAAIPKIGTQYSHMEARDMPIAATARFHNSPETPVETTADATSTAQAHT